MNYDSLSVQIPYLPFPETSSDTRAYIKHDAMEGIVIFLSIETAGYTLVDDMNYESIRQLQAKLDEKTQK